MDQVITQTIASQLEDRRGALQNAIAQIGKAPDLVRLLGDVDQALARLGTDAFGKCVVAHLSAIVRRTLDEAVSVARLIATVNRHLNERSPESHFVTLVAGRANRSGRVEICNAGHCQPIVLRRSESFSLNSSGLPVGIIDSSDQQTSVLQLDVGDSLILHTDGISEAFDSAGNQYGAAALNQTAFANRDMSPAPLAAACLDHLLRFQSTAPQLDDLTLLVLQRILKST